MDRELRELDDALRTYSAQPPPAGMQERILGRARSPKRPFWIVPLAAGLLLGIAFWPSSEPQVQRAIALPQPPAVEPIRSQPAAPPVRRATRKRPAQFPAPAPLTAEERALLVLVQRSPEAAPSLSAAVVPIRIDELQIEPLSDGN